MSVADVHRAAAEPPVSAPGSGPLQRGAPGQWVRSGFLTLVDQAAVSGTNFLTVILVGRAAGEKDLGLYALGFSIVQLILCIQQSLVLAPYMVYASREKQGAAEYAGSVLVHSGLLSLLTGILLGVLALLFLACGGDRFAGLLGVLAGAAPLILLREFGRRYAFAHLRIGTALVLDLAASSLQVGLLTWLVLAGELTALRALGVIGASCAVGGVAWLIRTRREFRFRRQRVMAEFKRSWAFGAWVLASNGTGLISAYLMYWLVLFLGLSATGLYSGCSILLDLWNPFILGIGNLATPVASRVLTNEGRSGLRKVVRLLTVCLASVLGLYTVLIALVGGWVAGVLFGPAYAGQGPLITLFALTTLVGAASIGSGVGLWALERSELNFSASLAALLVGLGAAALFMPWFGLFGAGLASLASALVNLAIKMTAFQRISRLPEETSR